MDQLATLWVGWPDWVIDAISRARALPYPALHAMAAASVIAVLSRSLAAILLSLMLVSTAGAVLLAHPTDQFGWTVFWTSLTASVLASAISFHRHRLARRVSLLREKVTELSQELADLRPKYERELIWRRAAERNPDQAE